MLYAKCESILKTLSFTKIPCTAIKYSTMRGIIRKSVATLRAVVCKGDNLRYKFLALTEKDYMRGAILSKKSQQLLNKASEILYFVF